MASLRTSLYFKKMAELCLKADRLCPEMLPALRSETASWIQLRGRWGTRKKHWCQRRFYVCSVYINLSLFMYVSRWDVLEDVNSELLQLLPWWLKFPSGRLVVTLTSLTPQVGEIFRKWPQFSLGIHHPATNICWGGFPLTWAFEVVPLLHQKMFKFTCCLACQNLKTQDGRCGKTQRILYNLETFRMFGHTIS